MRPGDRGVCIFRLVGWDGPPPYDQPYYGQLVTVMNITPVGELLVAFLTGEGSNYLSGEHQFHADLIVPEAEWELIKNTKGV